jgi:hypothetical protein
MLSVFVLVTSFSVNYFNSHFRGITLETVTEKRVSSCSPVALLFFVLQNAILVFDLIKNFQTLLSNK